MLSATHLTFWRDGFTMQDSPLMRYDDPANAKLLKAIHAGHAPPSLKVPVGRPVDVHVTSRSDDNYGRAFSGVGMRLGGRRPLNMEADPSLIFMITPTSGGSAAVSSRLGSTISQPFKFGESRSTTSLQIQFPDGQRMVWPPEVRLRG
ncbi:SEP domain-containing protein [Mycena alexandri]|uniref:SEP domain-containing protein n=1 Tax=Mycena alexandri TaxID=1745969 RepID=A0AAD6SCD0_9AGAR|nr:SEP domain-containing protein [Mycena alexandri]